MGPRGFTNNFASFETTNDAHSVVTGGKNRGRYREALRKWASIIFSIAQTETYEPIISTVGLMIYISWQDSARDIVNSAEKDGNLKLNEQDNYKNRNDLVETIMVTEESDSVMRKVELIENISGCERTESENMMDSTSRFKNAVSLYKTMLDP